MDFLVGIAPYTIGWTVSTNTDSSGRSMCEASLLIVSTSRLHLWCFLSPGLFAFRFPSWTVQSLVGESGTPVLVSSSSAAVFWNILQVRLFKRRARPGGETGGNALYPLDGVSHCFQHLNAADLSTSAPRALRPAGEAAASGPNRRLLGRTTVV